MQSFRPYIPRTVLRTRLSKGRLWHIAGRSVFHASGIRFFSADQQRQPENLLGYFKQFPQSLWHNDLHNIVFSSYESDKSVSASTEAFSSKLDFIVVPLKSRSLLELHGPDTVRLLQGMTTRDMEKPFGVGSSSGEDSNGMVTAVPTHVLNVRGRVLFDALVSQRPAITAAGQQETCLLFECDRSLLDNAAKHFTRYRLRSKVAISKDIDALASIFHIVPKIDPQTGQPKIDAVEKWLHQLVQDDGICGLFDVLCFQDPRLPSLGLRLYLISKNGSEQGHDSANAKLRVTLPGGNILVEDEQVYNQWRMINGVAEGAVDLPFEDSLPLEANIDLLNGVHFNKGCYVGQELTARTHFRGQVRKRIMPVIAVDGRSQPLPPADSKLNKLKDVDNVAEEQSAEEARMRERRLRRGVAKMCSSVGEIGLAVVQLADKDETLVYQPIPEQDESSERRVIRPIVPYWMQDNISGEPGEENREE